MVSFHVAAALRRLRRRGGDRWPRAGASRSLPWLLVGEAAHLLAGWFSPRLVVVISGLVAMVGTYVALGPDYPGLVVVVEVARVAAAVAVLAAAVVAARAMPLTWAAVSRGFRRTRVAVLCVGFAGLLSVVKVGLHEATPGPVLPASARWGMVAVGVALSLAWTLDGRRGSGSGP